MSSQPPFTLVSIDHLLLIVTGMESAVAFYEGVLGCTVTNRLPEYAMVELRAGASGLDLVDVSAQEGRWALPPVAGGRNVDHVCFALGTFEERGLRAYLTQRGVTIIEERCEESQLSLYVRDPSNNVVELLGRPT